MSTKICIIKRIKNSANDLEFRAVQKGANFIDLEKCCNMKIDLQKSASIRPRTSPDNFAV